ncbi:MAG TPA: phosphoribosylformylglycinamidine cyclo-ligase [Terriglobia bacterium]|nr:phosphoribosylformylglycinamidine cyclo-ligase [Terriglobia bacterium]
MRYKDAGVDFDAARRAKTKIMRLARQTFSKRVMRDVGAFGGFYSLRGLPRDAVLVASVDGVGTKLKIAFKLNRHTGVGADLVNHCVNDIAVHGAVPLFFLDYIATGKMRPAVVAEVVSGIAQACQEAECALIGGETAEMPCFYSADEYDLAGTIVGWVQKSRIVDGSRIRPGDLIIGLPSLGLHTNGYSLARKVLLETGRLSLDQTLPDLSRKLGDELLAPHRSYASAVRPLLAKGWLKGLVHVTGGGITDNTPRILPSGCQAQIVLGSWPVLPVFDLIARMGGVSEPEMLRTFNMGLGMLVVVAKNNVRSVASALERRGEKFWMVGQIVKGKSGVNYERRRC